MLRLRPWLLTLLVAGCSSRAALSPAEADRIHRVCHARLASGGELTRRSRDIGVLPAGSATHEKVVVYGATWCTTCHVVADYLARVGIPFVEHDVEADPDARAEMNRSLDLAALPRQRVLPVVEVRGTVMLGFMPCVVESAWRG